MPLISGPHMAPGLGDLTPGWFVLPQNSILDGMVPPSPMVASLTAAISRPVRIPGIGDLLKNTQYVIPNNPILDAAQKGTGCGGGCSGMGHGMGHGMGDFVSDSIAPWISADSPIQGVSNATFWGGLVVLGLVFMEYRGSKHSYRR